MNLSESYFDEIKTSVEGLLQEENVKGVAAEFIGREFTISYFRDGFVFERNFLVEAPRTRNRSIWYNVIIPQMNDLVEMLKDFAEELNLQFRKDYAALMKAQYADSSNKELALV